MSRNYDNLSDEQMCNLPFAERIRAVFVTGGETLIAKTRESYPMASEALLIEITLDGIVEATYNSTDYGDEPMCPYCGATAVSSNCMDVFSTGKPVNYSCICGRVFTLYD